MANEFLSLEDKDLEDKKKKLASMVPKEKKKPLERLRGKKELDRNIKSTSTMYSGQHLNLPTGRMGKSGRSSKRSLKSIAESERTNYFPMQLTQVFDLVGPKFKPITLLANNSSITCQFIYIYIYI